VQLDLTIEEPLEKAIDDWDFLEATIAKKFSTFRSVGSNIYGVRRRAVDPAAGITDPKKGDMSVVFELGPDGPVSHTFRSNNFHVIASGTPHHLPHSFGYWHINDMEELAVKFAGTDGDLGYSLLIMRRPTGSEGESFAWYCEDCLTLLYELRLRTGELGLGEFWRGEVQAVTTYNAAAKLRTCPECGVVNAKAYPWNTAKDTPELASARREGYGSSIERRYKAAAP
jgi:hypothetical protein